MSDLPLDRRAFFSQGLRRMLGKAVDVVQARVVAGRYVRPPGALPEPAFLAACTRCGECDRVCPVHAIHVLGTEHGLAAGTPALDVNHTACVMCTEMPCAAVCPTDALDVPEDGWLGVRMAVIAIDEERCIAHRDISCGVCARVCPVGEAALALDPRGRPVLGAACTGCGTCISACVTSPSSIAARAIGAYQ
ncbi:MAG TPA: 4Fe-4S dicluster domain-containing protein [Gemmatimonadaceae bacterium]|nr:4Fe-4S dicluster domain-containing protein [Gemmatimonadaceae bacterium]